MRTVMTTVTAIVAVLLTAKTAAAATALSVAPASGHPTQAVTISGTGFGKSELVDVYVDTVDTLLLVSSSTGTVSASVTVPASAQPGTHYLTAAGRVSNAAAQKTFLVTTPWTELGYGSAHLGYNPYENTLTTSNVSSLGTRWSVAGLGSGATPAVSGGRVIATGLTGIKALSANTGAVLWSALPSSFFYASPALAGSSVYVGDYTSGTMYALSATTGATLWTKALGRGIESSAVVVGATVYVGCLNDVVYALNASTGATLWSYTTGGGIDSSPAVSNGILYIGSEDETIYALNAATGAFLWSYPTGGAVEGTPAVSNGVVYIGSDDSAVYALSAQSGNLLWSYKTGGEVFYNAAVANGSVFVGSADRNVYSLNARTGALQWNVATPDITGGVAVANGIVYVTSRDGTLFALAASDGGILASGNVGFDLFGSPVISDGNLYIDADDNNISAFSLLAGTSAGTAKAPPRSALHPDLTLRVIQ